MPGLYSDALTLANSLNGKLKNDERLPITFKAVASIPCFELWLLLHYSDIQAPLHRDEALRLLKEEIEDYDKGMKGTYAATRVNLPAATERAECLAQRFTADDDPQPYTAVHELVALLYKLRN